LHSYDALSLKRFAKIMFLPFGIITKFFSAFFFSLHQQQFIDKTFSTL